MAKRKAPFIKTSRADKLKRRMNQKRRIALIAEHRAALKGIEKQRAAMGDEWADATREYRLRALRELGARS